MAPALTQATEPLTLAEATRHTSSPFFSKYKCLKVPASLLNGKPFTNGEKCTTGSVPPVFRGAECHSPHSVFGHIMEESPTLENSESTITEEAISRVQAEYPPSPESPAAVISDMGCHTNSMDLPISADAVTYNPKIKDSSESIFSIQQNDLLSFMDRDLGNVNDIIATLQKLASNPSLLDAAESEITTSVAESESPVIETTEERAASLLAKLATRQKQLDRKKEFLLRRIRRVSARGLTAAVSSQLDYLVSKGSRLRQEYNPTSCENADAPALSISSLHADSTKNMTTDLVNYVRKVEASQYLRKHGDAAVIRNRPGALPETLCAEADYIVSEMKAASLSQIGHDSDATESSSGGESCDEFETYHSTNWKPIQERAFYKYCQRRGKIASKWAWLRAQIADLDYKISQQAKVYTQLRSSKGEMTFIEECANGNKVRKVCKSTLHDSRDSQLTCITPPSMRFTVNGYHLVTPLEEPNSIENSCARTLSVSKLKRRRYIRPSAVLRRNRRSYMGSSLSLSAYKDQNKPSACSCIVPLTCVLCTNLQSNSVYNVYGMQFVKIRDLASLVQNRQNIKEKLAKVDPSFHTVLSKKSEMLQNEVYSNSLYNCHFQDNSLAFKEEDIEDDTEEPLNKRRKRDLRDIRRRKKDGLRLNIVESRKDQDMATEEDGLDFPNQELFSEKKDKIRNDSTNMEKSKKSSHKNKTNNSANSYDIDNIVIPQSMASISLVETLAYKEIMTPLWRICELSPIGSSSCLNDCDEEDISEETFRARHAVSEEKERKYFQKIQMKANQRPHRSRRVDSSGTNTPDQPMSPRTLDHFTENSPMGSPLVEQSEDSNHSSKSTQSINNNTVFTLSLSAIQSSILNNNGSPLNGSNMYSNDPSPVTDDSVGKTHRSMSINSDKFFRPITPASASHECEKECVSPFPCRDFPLDENECDTLNKPFLKGRGTHRKQKPRQNVVDKSRENLLKMGIEKSGRDSPLSEVTDSAPEEDDNELDDGSPVHFTISGVKDRSGVGMLQVQRN